MGKRQSELLAASEFQTRKVRAFSAFLLSVSFDVSAVKL